MHHQQHPPAAAALHSPAMASPLTDADDARHHPSQRYNGCINHEIKHAGLMLLLLLLRVQLDLPGNGAAVFPRGQQGICQTA